MKLAELTTGLLRRAVAAYLESAWAGTEPPERTRRLASLEGLGEVSGRELLAWEGFEREGNNRATRRVQLRLGNTRYPHMKVSLETLGESDEWVFSVDTHDRHLPPEACGESFRSLQQYNEALKLKMERTWADLGIDTARARMRDFVAREGAPGVAGADRGFALLVDDDPDILDVERIVVERAGYRALLAGSVEEALAKADACGCSISLALIDIMMPGKSGYELVEALRSKHAIAGPVLFLTAMMAGQVRNELCDKVLHKPFDIEQLRRTMQEALARG